MLNGISERLETAMVRRSRAIFHWPTCPLTVLPFGSAKFARPEHDYASR